MQSHRGFSWPLHFATNDVSSEALAATGKAGTSEALAATPNLVFFCFLVPGCFWTPKPGRRRKLFTLFDFGMENLIFVMTISTIAMRQNRSIYFFSIWTRWVGRGSLWAIYPYKGLMTHFHIEACKSGVHFSARHSPNYRFRKNLFCRQSAPHESSGRTDYTNLHHFSVHVFLVRGHECEHVKFSKL